METISFLTEPQLGKRTCFACLNGLVGEPKGYFGDDIWECRCREEYLYEVYCPFCDAMFKGSSYLSTVVSDNISLWLTNLITHYRHDHRCWDNQWRYIQVNCRPDTYDQTKLKVNNQIKRAFLRSKIFMKFAKEIGVNHEHFLNLQDNEDKTIELVKKKFSY